MGGLSLTEEAWSIISQAWIEEKQNTHTKANGDGVREEEETSVN